VAKKLTVQQLDHVLKADLGRGLDIIDKRASRKMASNDPVKKMIGRLTADVVDQIHDAQRPAN
jgi:hypothetical protein